MNASKTIRSQESNSAVRTKQAKPLQSARATAHEMLSSFSKVLTGREKIVLHSLAQGLSAGEIARRLQPPERVDIESGRKLRGGARSLSRMSAAGTSSTEEKIYASKPGLMPPTESLTGNGVQDANAS